MLDIRTYKTADLVLGIKKSFDPHILRLKEWEDFLDVLCMDREYQKEAIRAAIIYLASGEYSSIEDLVTESWKNQSDLRERYKDIVDYKKHIQLPHKLSGVIDLATATGKSFVMYGIAQIALGIGLVDRVLVLCPSLTIESGLTKKFEAMAGDDKLKSVIPANAVMKNPSIINASSTIVSGAICIENIHAVYEKTGSSISDSLKGQGESVLVLSDEVHHAYNPSVDGDKDIKKWKEFLLSADYGFKYMLGFTGTAYIDDEYFNDVIYRFSIREAMEQRFVKLVQYVSRDESRGREEKLQVIYANHSEFKKKYPKALTILVTKDIKRAKQLTEELIEFLVSWEKRDRSDIEDKVLIVTSHKDHRKNIVKLQNVDDKDSPVEWIISVSMLTEGWDVKNVFQIVPWEDRAFNSKLLIAQVLGRGLRMPENLKGDQPKVRVYNHDAWSRNIEDLVNEVLEYELRLTSRSLGSGQERSKHHFDVNFVKYEKEEKEIKNLNRATEVFDYSKGKIKLITKSDESIKETEYVDMKGGLDTKKTVIKKKTFSIDDITEKIVETFETRELEAKVRFPEGKIYEKEELPPESEIRKIVINSMKEARLKGNVLTEDNAGRIYSAFQTLFRPSASTLAWERTANKPEARSTRSLENESIGIGKLKHGWTVFYSQKYKDECLPDVLPIFAEVVADGSLPRNALKEINPYLFKTPLDFVFAKSEPERKFIDMLIKDPLAEKITAWVKSRDVGFYSIEYSMRRANRSVISTFNPDFFIKVEDKIVVVEIKDDEDESDENRAKFRWGKRYFDDLNRELKKLKLKERYFFHFLSPSSYYDFSKAIVNGTLFEEEGTFRTELEDLLES